MPEEIRNRSFSPDEVAKMASARVFIETPVGEMEVAFFPEVAPNHVDSFLNLARTGFYDGTIFHRVIPGFVIQGGDPNSKSEDRTRHGMGGPGYCIKAEFNKKPHKRGVLSMARSAMPDSGGSQFFVCVADIPHLDNQYTVFGTVVAGMDVADKIVNQPRDRADNPVERMTMKMRVKE